MSPQEREVIAAAREYADIIGRGWRPCNRPDLRTAAADAHRRLRQAVSALEQAEADDEAAMLEAHIATCCTPCEVCGEPAEGWARLCDTCEEHDRYCRLDSGLDVDWEGEV